MTNLGRPGFPCQRMPEDDGTARLLGIYDQCQEGLFMQRLKIRGGRLTLTQWRTVAELAMRYTPEYPLHLTTRQDLEFHGVTAENIPALHQGLYEADITTVGACGDTLRNITLCPQCDRSCRRADLEPLAGVIEEAVQAIPWIYDLPRKFKMSFSGCANGCARPWVNDSGFVATGEGTFRVMLAGSLGTKALTGILAYEELTADDVPHLAMAALRLFDAEGDRKNRARARLRHVRERMGDEKFLSRIDELFMEEKKKDLTVDVKRTKLPKTALKVQLHVPHGELLAERVLHLVEEAERAAGEIRVGFEHDLFVFGVTREDLPPDLWPLADNPRIVACPGSHFCSRGITPTWDLADGISGTLPKGCSLMIEISGCPNNCPQAAVADIGLVGRLKTVDGERIPHYRVLAGGGGGSTDVLAIELNAAMPESEIPRAVNCLIHEWGIARSQETVTFADFIARDHERLAEELELSMD
ncbi:hypothetical protein ACFL1X_05575 [Candidatus Hydrogenedentota bacterium]